jgi:RimJ/RimL family protein N-acetyltransferase
MTTCVPELRTDRLLLRAFTQDDFAAFTRIVADPEVMRFLDGGQPITPEECWRGMALFIGHWHLRGYGWWAVEDCRSGAFIGRIGLYNPEGWPGIEIGWLLGRETWGCGLATEGAAAALRFAFEVIGLERVISLIDPENRRSIRVAEKLGGRYEGSLVHNNKRVALYETSRSSPP